MTENHFQSHFSPFQINTQLFFLTQNDCRRPFWMTKNHFRLHFSPFQINTQFLFFFHKMAAGGHFGGPKITFDHISRHFRSIRNFDCFCLQPFCMSEIHFRWHFWPFQIDRPFSMSEIHFRCISGHFIVPSHHND